MEEMLKKLELLREELGKNTTAVAKVDALERTLLERSASIVKIEAQLEAIKAESAAREKQIETLRREARVVGIERDGVRTPDHGLRVMGMMAREALAQHERCELPVDFKHEVQLLREYRERTLDSGATTGSYLVPAITNAELLDAVEEVSDILSRVDLVSGLPGASTFYWPVLTARSALKPARATVDTAATASAPTFDQLSVSPNEAYVYFPVTNRLLQMSAVDLGRICQQNLRDAMIQGIADWVISGDGTSTYNSFTGILAQSAAAYVSTLPAGKTAFGDLTVSDLRKAKQKLLKRGRARGVALMSLEVLGVIEDLDRQGKTQIVTYDNAGNARVMMMPVVLDEGMPTLDDSAVSKGFIALGDLQTMLVAIVGQIEFAVSSEVLFDKLQTAFRAVINMGIARKPAATLVTLKTPAV